MILCHDSFLSARRISYWGYLLPFLYLIGSFLLFSLYWVILTLFFFLILGRFLPFFHYIGSFFTLFILYWVISYPFFIILCRFLPFLYYIEDFVPSSLYLIDVFHNLLYKMVCSQNVRTLTDTGLICSTNFSF